MLDPAIAASVSNYLHVLDKEGIAPRFGVIFGSQVSGKPHEWSDIDLVVVSPRFDQRPINYDDVDRLWRIAGRTDNRIEPIACGEAQWDSDDSSTIIEIARREGVRVAVA